METLLEVNDLEGMAAGDVDSALDHCHGSECATKLVYLCMQQSISFPADHGKLKWVKRDQLTQYIRAQYQASTKKGNFFNSLLKK